jgi:hypothetical protein
MRLSTILRRHGWAIVLLVGLAVAFLYHARHDGRTRHVLAQTGFTPQALLQSPSGGMAQYGQGLLTSTSSQATLQVLSSWNSYINSRCNWTISAANVSRLATADWNARRAGSPTITAQQLANAANHLIHNQLATMTAVQQQTLFSQMMTTSTPKGNIGLNPNYPFATGSKNADGTFTITVQAAAFSDMKTNLLSMAPGMFTSSANFYPGEAMMVAYSVATWDMGYGSAYVTKLKQRLGDLTDIDMTNQSLYGQNGYLIRRPVTTFLTDAAISQFFTNLGF